MYVWDSITYVAKKSTTTGTLLLRTFSLKSAVFWIFTMSSFSMEKWRTRTVAVNLGLFRLGIFPNMVFVTVLANIFMLLLNFVTPNFAAKMQKLRIIYRNCQIKWFTDTKVKEVIIPYFKMSRLHVAGVGCMHAEMGTARSARQPARSIVRPRPKPPDYSP